MLHRLDVSVTAAGEDVTLTLGNCAWLMGYPVALDLSARMRTRAQQARRAFGETGRRFSIAGTLHDAERGPDADQPNTPGRVYPVARERLKSEQIGAGFNGTMVTVKLGTTEAALPYPAALKIAQWIRLRAKESKRRAGDVDRHWSAVCQPSDWAR